MKKIGVFVVFCLTMFLVQSVFAWTVDVSKYASADKKQIMRIELTGDGTALSQNIWDLITAPGVFSANQVRGKYIYRHKTDPDDSVAPGSTYALTITDAFGDVATLPDLSTTVTESGLLSDVSASGGFLGMYSYLLLTCEDIGTGNKTVLFLELVE